MMRKVWDDEDLELTSEGRRLVSWGPDTITLGQAFASSTAFPKSCMSFPPTSSLGTVEIAFHHHACRVLMVKMLRLPKSQRWFDGTVVRLDDAHG